MKNIDININSILEGTIYKQNAHLYTVCVQEHMITCSLSTSYGKSDWNKTSKKKKGRHADYKDKHAFEQDKPITGDRVRISINADGTGCILERLPRSNTLSRRSSVPMPGARSRQQLIAANIDQLITVFAIAEPQPKWNMLDRYLALAESQDIPALICISKGDLANSEQPVLQARTG